MSYHYFPTPCPHCGGTGSAESCPDRPAAAAHAGEPQDVMAELIENIADTHSDNARLNSQNIALRKLVRETWEDTTHAHTLEWEYSECAKQVAKLDFVPQSAGEPQAGEKREGGPELTAGGGSVETSAIDLSIPPRPASAMPNEIPVEARAQWRADHPITLEEMREVCDFNAQISMINTRHAARAIRQIQERVVFLQNVIADIAAGWTPPETGKAPEQAQVTGPQSNRQHAGEGKAMALQHALDSMESAFRDYSLGLDDIDVEATIEIIRAKLAERAPLVGREKKDLG